MRGRCTFSPWLFVLAAVGADLGDRAAAAEPGLTPRQIFEQRIMPIFRSPNASSCTQCHLAGVDLKKYIIPSTSGKTDGHQKTFLSLRDQGLIDLDDPAKSKILGFIQKREPGADAGGAAIHEKVRQLEFEAFAEWIKESCKDAALRTAPRLRPEELAGPTQAAEVIRHTRKDRLLESFEQTIWAMRFRCVSCHGEGDGKQPNAHAAKYGPRVTWLKKDAETTMNYLIATKRLIDVKNPEKSLLLQKATGEVDHVGGGKLKKTVVVHPQQVEEGDLGYKGFRRWLEDYARVVNGEYRDAAGLPKKKEAFHEYATEMRLRFDHIPPAWANHFVRVDLYAWDEAANAWEPNPVATGDGVPADDRALWRDGMYLNLVAEKGSERARRWATGGVIPTLPGRRHLVRVYVDRDDRIKKDWRQNMRDEDYVGRMELDGELPVELLPAEVQRIARLVGQLDHRDFGVRERATAELEALGPVFAAVRQALDNADSPEVRHRGGLVLANLQAKFNPASLDARKLR